MGTTTRALLVIDVQNDFVEGGSLGVSGGTAVAADVTDFLARHGDRYAAVIASRDWHDPATTNGGHFPPSGQDPDFRSTWPPHCVAGTPGAEYAPGLDTDRITAHLRKGLDEPAYSAFQGRTDDGRDLPTLLADVGATHVDVVGIATDHCVRATVLDARRLGLDARVLVDLTAGVAADTTRAAVEEMTASGAQVTTSDQV